MIPPSILSNLDTMHGEKISGQVTATGRDDKSRVLDYVCLRKPQIYDPLDPTFTPVHWNFYVAHSPADCTSEDAGYWATFVELDDALISTEMSAIDEYRELGLPEAIILEMGQLGGKKVMSSSNKEKAHLLRSEYRNIYGEKPWRRLADEKQASYDPAIDRYTLLESPAS